MHQRLTSLCFLLCQPPLSQGARRLDCLLWFKINTTVRTQSHPAGGHQVQGMPWTSFRLLLPHSLLRGRCCLSASQLQAAVARVTDCLLSSRSDHRWAPGRVTRMPSCGGRLCLLFFVAVVPSPLPSEIA